MLFKPYGNELWFSIKRKLPPDDLTLYYERGWGEFSVISEIAFE